MKRLIVLISLAAGVALTLAGVGAPVAAAPVFPSSIPLPDGFYPEGIAVGRGHDFYAASLLDGAVYKGDLRTGEGAVIASGTEGRLVAGLSFDERSGLVWGVGIDGGSGAAFAFDGRSGELVAHVEVPGVFLNDLTVTRKAAYITDSMADVFWTIPLDNRGRPAGAAHATPLTGDFTLVTTGDFPINLNGITSTPDGSTLVAVHSALGVLYRIDPATGVASQVDLGSGAVPSGDGILLHGNTLYVVQNFLNQVAVITLDPEITTGHITEVITSDLFRVPTTTARFGSSLYLVNARFDVAPPPVLGGPVMSIDYDVVRVRA
jgi:sugar lactone lactonase YvrE